MSMNLSSNKENCHECVGNSRATSFKADSKKRFGSLLNNAAKEVRDEADEKAVAKANLQEANYIMQEWKQETKDQELARDLSQKLAKEMKLEQSLEASKGEAEALRLAVEESRRVKAAAQAKREIEAQDIALAKQLQDDDEYELKERRRIEEEDAKLAASMRGSIDLAAVAATEDDDNNNDDDDDDSFVADSDSDADTNEFYRSADSVYGDGTAAGGGGSVGSADEEYKCDDDGVLHSSSQEYSGNQQLESDAEMAARMQRELDLYNEQFQAQQRLHEFKLSRKVFVAAAREEFKRKKRLDALAAMPNALTEAMIETQWDTATAEIVDVCGGICITLQLPNIKQLSIKPKSKGKKLLLDAKRMVLTTSPIEGPAGKRKPTTTIENSEYVAEFRLQGKNIKIGGESINYEYFSETGLLHIFVDNLLLDLPGRRARSVGAATVGTGAEDAPSSGKSARSGGGGSNSSRGRAMSGKLSSAVKNGLRRVIRRRQQQQPRNDPEEKECK